MKLKKTYTLLIHSFLITLLMVTNASAADVTVLGSISQTLKQTDNKSVLKSNTNNKNTNKEIKLLRIELSEAKKQELKSRAKQVITPINHGDVLPVLFFRVEQFPDLIFPNHLIRTITADLLCG